MSLSWLDSALICFFVFQLVLGFQHGLLLGVMSLVGYAVAAMAVLIGAPWLAEALNRQFHWPVGPVVLISAVLLLVAVRFATGGLTAWVHQPLYKRPVLRGANRWLGVLPGAAWGVVGGVLLTWLYSAFLGPVPANSPLASQLMVWGEQPMNAAAQRLPQGLPAIVMVPGGWEVVPGNAPAAQVSPTQLEKDMLARVNKERTQRGLKALAWDGALAEVGRRHSADMLKQSYFAHEDPQGRTVADRARKARVGYFMIGENLAFAPNMAIAHKGLMNSPGHRENILRPGYTRMGIGVIVVKRTDPYVPRHKGQAPPNQLRGFGGYLLVTQVFKR